MRRAALYRRIAAFFDSHAVAIEKANMPKCQKCGDLMGEWGRSTDPSHAGICCRCAGH
jgi:hypothetical protein